MTGQVYIAAAYCRLSRDDGGLESVSIETQKKIIADYCKSNGIMIYDYYCDDGFTGTNFDRPHFQKMIRDIEEKKVNTVIVKDLSRMGRDSAEVSNWVDKRFFECGIRFIALGDNIDSGIAEYDSFYFAVRNVFNEMYPLDCSKKTKMALTTRAKNGQFVGSKAPYGYKKSETDKHILEIDENVSDNVKLIFKLASENNYGFNKIARVLSEIRIPTPKEYAEKKENPSCDWNLTSVKKILEDEVYIGNLTYGRRHKVSFKSKKIIKQSKDKWIVTENTHPAIISREEWEKAHNNLKSRKRTRQCGEQSIFAGLVYCDTCGYALSLSPSKTQDDFYCCNTYKKKGKNRCSIHYIKYSDLCDIVLKDIQKQIKLFTKDENKYAELLKSRIEENSSETIDKALEFVKKAESEIEKTDTIITKLYEDRVTGKLPEETFTMILTKQNAKKIELYKELAKAKEKYERAKESQKNIEYFLDIIRSVKKVTLSAELLNSLIDRIEISDKYVVDGKTRQDVKIKYKFIYTQLL
ncbi:MAG: recombinase family protein [Oscillospiraceae bacterium]|nr:recombinase family protein [Oscillospiraceae bacterium]